MSQCPTCSSEITTGHTCPHTKAPTPRELASRLDEFDSWRVTIADLIARESAIEGEHYAELGTRLASLERDMAATMGQDERTQERLAALEHNGGGDSPEVQDVPIVSGSPAAPASDPFEGIERPHCLDGCWDIRYSIPVESVDVAEGHRKYALALEARLREVAAEMDAVEKQRDEYADKMLQSAVKHSEMVSDYIRRSEADRAALKAKLAECEKEREMVREHIDRLRTDISAQRARVKELEGRK